MESVCVIYFAVLLMPTSGMWQTILNTSPPTTPTPTTTIKPHKLHWSDCSDPTTRVVEITSFDISPMPLLFPGNATVSLRGQIFSSINLDYHSFIKVMVDKKLLGHWHPVPCAHNVGTCTYDDPCELMLQYVSTHGCPQTIINSGLTCTCQFTARSFDIHLSNYPVLNIPDSWSFLATGEFRSRIELHNGLEMIGCISAEWSSRWPCQGFLCG